MINLSFFIKPIIKNDIADALKTGVLQFYKKYMTLLMTKLVGYKTPDSSAILEIIYNHKFGTYDFTIKSNGEDLEFSKTYSLSHSKLQSKENLERNIESLKNNTPFECFMHSQDVRVTIYNSSLTVNGFKFMNLPKDFIKKTLELFNEQSYSAHYILNDSDYPALVKSGGGYSIVSNKYNYQGKSFPVETLPEEIIENILTNLKNNSENSNCGKSKLGASVYTNQKNNTFELVLNYGFDDTCYIFDNNENLYSNLEKALRKITVN